MNNVHIQEDDEMIVFTTNDRDAAKILEKIIKSDSINITESEEEINGFHWQGCMLKSA